MNRVNRERVTATNAIVGIRWQTGWPAKDKPGGRPRLSFFLFPSDPQAPDAIHSTGIGSIHRPCPTPASTLALA